MRINQDYWNGYDACKKEIAQDYVPKSELLKALEYTKNVIGRNVPYAKVYEYAKKTTESIIAQKLKGIVHLGEYAMQYHLEVLIKELKEGLL